MQIRDEQVGDEADIRRLTTDAFAGRPYADGDEADVIDRLRSCGDLVLSLVATEADALLGQITFSPAALDDAAGPWFALGPVSVAPERQGEGIGRALIETGLERIYALGARGCILTGNPDYYRRFGFAAAPSHAPEAEPAEYFMLRRLRGAEPEPEPEPELQPELQPELPPELQPELRGRFSFHAAFYGDIPDSAKRT